MDPLANFSDKKVKNVGSIAGTLLTTFFTVLFIALVVWSFVGLVPDLVNIRNGSDGVRRFVGPMIPQSRLDWSQDLTFIKTLKAALFSTIQMAVGGTVIGALLAFPASFFAARTGIIPRPVSGGIKSVFNIGRSVPTIIVALIVVGSVGLGDAAGAITIALVTFVTLTKLFAEALETVNPGPIEAVKAVGGDSASVFVYGMMPQVFPVYVSTALYSLEINLQSSFIIGIVGAGGLGYELMNDLRVYDLQAVGVIVFIMIVGVNLVDYISYRLRRVFA